MVAMLSGGICWFLPREKIPIVSRPRCWKRPYADFCSLCGIRIPFLRFMRISIALFLNRQRLRNKANDIRIKRKKGIRIPQSEQKSAYGLFQHLGRETMGIFSRGRNQHIPPESIATIIVDHSPRFDYIALSLAHFVTLSIHNVSQTDDVLEARAIEKQSR